MIKCENDGLKIQGTLPEIEADLTLIINKVRSDILVPLVGEEEAEKRIQRIIELSKKTDEEIKEQAMSEMHKVFDNIFKGMLSR